MRWEIIGNMGELNYTTINHTARKKLGISLNEYAVCDLIYHLSHHPKSTIPGWCYASKSALADTLDIERRSIIRIINRLIEKNLLVRDEGTAYLKTTSVWYEEVILTNGDKKSHNVSKNPLTKCDKKSQGVTKSHSDKKSHNNNIYNINNKTNTNTVFSSTNKDKEQTVVFSPKTCTGKQPKVCGSCPKCSILPCTPLQLWEIAKSEDIWIDDVLAKHNDILRMNETDELKKYKAKTMIGTLRNWLRTSCSKGFIRKMDDLQRLMLENRHPEKRKKLQILISRAKGRGIL